MFQRIFVFQFVCFFCVHFFLLAFIVWKREQRTANRYALSKENGGGIKECNREKFMRQRLSILSDFERYALGWIRMDIDLIWTYPFAWSTRGYLLNRSTSKGLPFSLRGEKSKLLSFFIGEWVTVTDLKACTRTKKKEEKGKTLANKSTFAGILLIPIRYSSFHGWIFGMEHDQRSLFDNGSFYDRLPPAVPKTAPILQGELQPSYHLKH